MVKSGTASKSVWAQLGRGGSRRDAEVPSAPIRVSEDAQANAFEKRPGNLIEFSQQKRDQLPERPSTSAGPASSFVKRKNAEKRETKDDLHFNPLAVHGKGTTFYNFPLPGALPTPASSPKSSAPSPHKSSVARPSTPESMEITPAPAPTAKMNVAQAQIGMALGSPSHAPGAWQEPVETYSRQESPDQMDSSVDGSSVHAPTIKHKPSRWKILGGIFGGGRKAQPAFYQLQPEVPQRAVEPEYDFVQEPTSSEKRPKSRGRGWSNSTKRKNKSDMSRSNTPAFDMSGARAAAATPEITLEGGPLIENAPKHAQKGAGLLDVDIPTIHMERYSIMFSGVLQKPQQTSSSLLARRQATLDKLKTVNEALASKEQEIEAKTKLLLTRRATSPSTIKTQSPAFSLFPNTPSRTRDPSPSSRPKTSGNLHRSNTSPAALSPSRPSFAPGPDNEAHARLVAREHGRSGPEKTGESHDTRVTKIKKQDSKSGRPSTASPTPRPAQWPLDKSHLTLDDNSDNEEDEAVIIKKACEKEEDVYDPAPFPMKPKIVEPDWQIINPPHTHTTAPSVSSSTTAGSSHSTRASNSSSISTPLSSGLPAKPNMPSPPLASASSPQAQTRARAATVASRSPPTTRSRSATTTTPSSMTRRSPQSIPENIDSPTLYSEPVQSMGSVLSSQPSQSKPRPSLDEDEEARLKSLADVSIARQISVSRQQRQLLVPIKTSLKSVSSNGNLKRSPSSHIPVLATGNGASIVNVGRAASPLSSVAVTAQGRSASPLAGKSERIERKEGEQSSKPTERLVAGVKPVTPTLVVVGNNVDEREKKWAGATQTLKPANVGLAERRRLLAQAHNAAVANGNGIVERPHNHAIGEIRVGLTVNPKEADRGERAARQKELRDLQNRKSERVVVERISVASN
ncbi:hypothetical protein EG329_014208 [Mollisiaceae sp. DMI_Dod_QoI]|nr:hypothetical protein EG329_014208 [Helotiales sp. DMI_Dod_QoI]